MSRAVDIAYHAGCRRTIPAPGRSGAVLDLGELSEPALQSLAGGSGPTNHENRVVTADSAEHVWPRFSVKRGSDRLGPTRYGSNYNELTDSVDTCKQLRQQRVEGRAGGAADGTVGGRIAHALGRGDACEPQLAKVTRQRGLCDGPAALMQEHAELFLAPDWLVVHELEDCSVALSLVHPELSP